MSTREIPWVIEEHTQVKHQLLEGYIPAWMRILFSQQARMGSLSGDRQLIYFDGFAGPGLYWTDESRSQTVPGSPIIVANAANRYLVEHPNYHVIITGIDSDRRCIPMLQAELDRVNTLQQSWQAVHGTFEAEVNALFDRFARSGRATPPGFFFIDPFGYSGFTMNTLQRILQHPRTELFITFMIYDIVRFLTEEHAKSAMRELFGTDAFAAASALQGEAKITFLSDLYCRQLRTAAGAKFVQPFRINTPSQGTRPRYLLIHASGHLKALKVMKDAMRKSSSQPFRFEAIGLDPNRQLELFESSSEEGLRERIYEHLGQHPHEIIPYQDVEDWAYPATRGTSIDIKSALIHLEAERDLRIHRLPGQRVTSVVKGANIERPNVVAGSQL